MDVRQFVNGACSLSETLTRLADHFDSNGAIVAFFGFYVHLDALKENDFIFEFSHKHEYENLNIKEAYMNVGGVRDDFYAPTIPGRSSVVEVVLPDPAKAMEMRNDARLGFVNLLLNLGAQQGWMAPIHASWLGGYGTLYIFHFDKDGTSPLSSEEHLHLAYDFF